MLPQVLSSGLSSTSSGCIGNRVYTGLPDDEMWHTLPGARSPREALAVLRRIVALPDHVFWEDDISIATSEFVDETKLYGHRQVSDIHLLALALRHGGRVATLDRGIMHLVPAAYSAAALNTGATSPFATCYSSAATNSAAAFDASASSAFAAPYSAPAPINPISQVISDPR